MSDSVDRVFVHALQTVRRLPRTGSSRPPPQARLRLYGLYKQSMEGDVLSILPRPTLPPTSPNLDPTPASSNPTVHRYASHDLRAREAQAEIEKWDAWNACAGISRTEAKRRYISTLIETMKVYASGTQESRELVGELEFVWGQIRSQTGSEESGNGDGDSPTRILQRAGLHQTESYASIPPGRGDMGDGGGGSRDLRPNSSALRLLSPVSQGGSGDIVEGEDADVPEMRDEEVEEEEEDFQDASESHPRTPNRRSQKDIDSSRWRRRIESALSTMTVEIAALREQLQMSESRPARRRTGLLAWMRWLIWAATRQVFVNLVLVLLFVLWGRLKGDRTVEEWIRRRLKGIQGLMSASEGRRRLPSLLKLY